MGPYLAGIMLILLGGILVATEYGLQVSRFYGQLLAAPLGIIGLAFLIVRVKTFTLKRRDGPQSWKADKPYWMSSRR